MCRIQLTASRLITKLLHSYDIRIVRKLTHKYRHCANSAARVIEDVGSWHIMVVSERPQ